MRIKLVYTDWFQQNRIESGAYGGCGYYRVVKPAEHLKFRADVFGKLITQKTHSEEMWTKFFKGIDLAVIRHFDNPLAISQLFGASAYFDIPVIIDMDDNFIDVPENNPASEGYYKGSDCEHAFAVAMRHAAGVTVSTKPLKKIYEKYNSNVVVLPNLNDFKDWPIEATWQRIPKGKDEIRIIYAGSHTHFDDLQMVMPALKEVLDKYPNVKILMAGYMPPFMKKEFGDRVTGIFGTKDWRGYNELLYSLNADIAIAPLVNNEFNLCKSHIKWMEYSMYKYPVIASNIGEYKKYIRHRKTGLLADNKTEVWRDAIIEFIERPRLAKKIASNAFNYIRKNLQWTQHIQKWETFYKETAKGGTEKLNEFLRTTTTTSKRDG